MNSQLRDFAGDGYGFLVTWIYCAFALCLITGGVVFMFRRNKRRNRTHRHRRRIHTHAPVSAPVIKNKAPVNSKYSTPLSVAGINNAAHGHARLKPVSNGDSHGAKPFHDHRRKRIFDYPKFYTKVVSELSRHKYGPPANKNGKPHANGHGHSNSNGHAAPNGTNAHQTAKSEINDLIAAQKSLIEEQKNILEQQTRLIEEKRRLIEEQTSSLNDQPRPAANLSISEN